MSIIKTTLTDSVYERLRALIISLELKPGERISVDEIARRLEVSPTPVREALHRLVEEGFVEQKPYVGFFVVNLTAEDVEELFEIRKTLEVLALTRLLLNEQTQKTIACLLETLETIKCSEAFYKNTQIFDEKFHIDFILKNSNGRWLTKLAKDVIDLIKMTTRMSQNPWAAYNEHRNILLALQRNDKKTAIKALVFHLDRAKQETINSFVQGGDREK